MKKSQFTVTRAADGDAEEILRLQKLAYISEAELYDDYTIPPLTQTLKETLEDFKNYTVLKAVSGGKIIGSVRGQFNGNFVYIARLMVHPDFQNKGVGTKLMNAVEAEFPQVKKFALGTGYRSERNLHLYHKLGFKDKASERFSDKVTMIHLEKTVR